MTKTEAHEILNRIREGQSIPLSLTNQALERTGDICGVFDESLCSDGNAPRNDRASPTPYQGVEGRFSYSRYLDCCPTEGITQ